LKKAGRRDPHCEACDRQWFGPVAFCPYCGRRSALQAGAGAATAPFEQPVIEPAPAPDANAVAAMRQRRPMLLKMALAGVAATLLVWAAATFAPSERPTLESRRPATTAVMGAAPPAAAPAPAPQPAKPSASATRSRLLCSPANAASGLCKWQE
jgi:hypothetical protein